MTPREAGKLLGGYGTGTLTAEERAALFAAALEDQALFDALADEQALCELLADPTARARLLAALAEAGTANAAAWWRRPAVALALAAVVVLAVALVRVQAPAPERTVQMAQVREAAPAPEQAAPPVEAMEPKRAKPARARKAEAVPPPPPPVAPQAALAAGSGAGHRPAQGALGRSGTGPTEPLLGWTVLLDAARHARTVRTGEAFRLEITSAARGWIYVLEPDGAGGWKTAASGAVGPDRPLRFPDAGALRFDEPGLRLWRAAYSPSRPASIPAAPPADALSIAVDVQR